MKYTVFSQTNHIIEDAYSKWLLKKFPKGMPENFKPGPGILSELAVKNNVCNSTTKESGDWLVCGRPLWNDKKGSDAYLCDPCEKQRGHYKDQPEPTEKMKAYLKKIMQ